MRNEDELSQYDERVTHAAASEPSETDCRPLSAGLSTGHSYTKISTVNAKSYAAGNFFHM